MLNDWVSILETALFNSLFTSIPTALFCGIPQGLVLGPVLFLLYMFLSGQLISYFDSISYHCYADDLQIYFSFSPQCCPKFLKRRAAKCQKTEMLVLAIDNVALHVKEHLHIITPSTQSKLRNHGVFFYQNMSFEHHLKSLSQSCFFPS